MLTQEEKTFLETKDKEAKARLREELEKTKAPEDFKAKMRAMLERAWEGKPVQQIEIPSKNKPGRVENVPKIFTQAIEGQPDQVPEQIRQRLAHYTPHFHKWIDYSDPLPGLLFYGDFGRGKTGMAVELMRHCAANFGCVCRYEKVQDLLAKIKQTYDDGGGREKDVVDYFKRYHVLTIDEIGAQHATEYERNILYWIVVSRYELLHPTIFTTNLNPQTAEGRAALYACLGERICSRFADHLVNASEWGGNLRDLRK